MSKKHTSDAKRCFFWDLEIHTQNIQKISRNFILSLDREQQRVPRSPILGLLFLTLFGFSTIVVVLLLPNNRQEFLPMVADDIFVIFFRVHCSYFWSLKFLSWQRGEFRIRKLDFLNFFWLLNFRHEISLHNLVSVTIA